MDAERESLYKSLWNFALEFVKKSGYEDEIEIFKKIKPIRTQDEFLAEYAWVVFASGFKVKILEAKWDEIEKVFFNFDVDKIVQAVEKDPEYFHKIKMPINNKRKIDAVVETAILIKKEGYKKFMNIEEMRKLPFIGEVTKFHLARNLGLDVGKPDRWMIRLAEKLGFPPTAEGVNDMLENFSYATGEKKGVIDIVLWRACEQGWLKELDKEK